MYHKIYEFCKVRNKGSVYYNDPINATPRVKYLESLLKDESIKYEIDRFQDNDVTCYNIILKGDSNRMVIAHHDIVNSNIDNANDNSASVINAIALKKLMPEIHVVLLDGEEVGGLGSNRLSSQIKTGEFGNIEWVLNLELTGRGGKYFFIGDYPGKLTNHIKSLFDCPVFKTPFNDSVILRKWDIDSVVINSLPILNQGTSSIRWGEYFLDHSMLFNCHSNKDSIDTISTDDMKEFVESILVNILKK
jgi:hypothetical protein